MYSVIYNIIGKLYNSIERRRKFWAQVAVHTHTHINIIYINIGIDTCNDLQGSLRRRHVINDDRDHV
jgi:hypothetical protein